MMGISISELASRIKMQPHTLRRYSRNESQPKPDLAMKLATVFGCDPAEVLGLTVRNNNIPLAKIPLYGSAEAGPGADITDMDRAIDHISRPPFLLSATNAYAIFVVGESMSPRFRSGEIVYVDPAVPVRTGGDAIIQMADNKGNLTAIIKEFVAQDDDKLSLFQHNPNKKLKIPTSNVTSIHGIRGMYVT
jgi:phage repressor protein C with HTH and peptisase S24 domain